MCLYLRFVLEVCISGVHRVDCVFYPACPACAGHVGYVSRWAMSVGGLCQSVGSVGEYGWWLVLDEYRIGIVRNRKQML